MTTPPPSPDANPAPADDAAVPAAPVASWSTGAVVAAVLLALATLLSLSMAWKAQKRVGAMAQELVKRQQESQTQATDAQSVAQQTQDSLRDALAKLTLLEARVAEVAVQRTQLEDLIQSLSRSRDENVLVDIEAGLRVALQQTAITGSAEPLVAALRQSDERLARYSQPRLEGVRRAIARDLDRVKAVGVADIASLALKLDEVVRVVDDLPLMAGAEGRQAARAGKAAAGEAEPAASAPGSSASSPLRWTDWAAAREQLESALAQVWAEARSLVRVTRIDHPDAMLLAPEQAFFLRENLKLRLLNARLALLSRQFDTAQADLQLVQLALERYFDRSSRRAASALQTVRQVASQARQVVVPRPDDTLAALSAAGAGR